MKFLVAGVGFVGANVVAQLTEAGHDAFGVDADPHGSAARLARLGVDAIPRGVDVTDFLQVAAVVQETKPEYIIDTVALNAAFDRQPALMLRVNTLGLVNLLEAARIFGAKRVVYTSSDVVYPRVVQDDADLPEGGAVFPQTFYGMTKFAAEGMGHNYARHAGVDFVALRFTHVFGGGSGSPGQAIERLVEAAVRDRPAIIDGPRTCWVERQDFLYVKDAARALITASAAGPVNHRAMNVTMGVAMTFDEVVEVVRAEVNPNFHVRYEIDPKSGYRGDPAVPKDSSLAMRQLDFRIRYDMPAAITDFAVGLRAGLG